MKDFGLKSSYTFYRTLTIVCKPLLVIGLLYIEVYAASANKTNRLCLFPLCSQHITYIFSYSPASALLNG